MSQNREFDDRLYLAHGILTIDSEKQIECFLQLSFNADKDNSEICCYFYLRNEDVAYVLEMLDSRTVQYASFDGSLHQGGKISVEKMGLDSATMSSYSLKDKAISKYELKLENLVKILGRLGILSSIGNYLHSNYLITLRYITVSPISIVHEQTSETEPLLLKWGLCNLEFGQRRQVNFRNIKETFEVCLPSFNIKLEKTEDYDFLISKLVKESGSAVTCFATYQGTYRSPYDLFNHINKLCFLLSFATSNWVTPMFCDLYRENNLVQTVVFNTKRRGFIKSRYLIDITNIKDLKNYLESTYLNYSQLLEDFPLNKSIDYIISSLGSSTLQDSFIIAYVALENLSSKIEEFAEKQGKIILPQAISDMKNLLRNLFGKLNKSFTEEELGFVANKVAYKKISVKDAQRFILNYYDVTFDDATLRDLYEVRNSLFHGSDFEHQQLRIKTNELYDLVSKALLKMSGWKGTYFSRQRGYLLTELD